MKSFGKCNSCQLGNEEYIKRSVMADAAILPTDILNYLTNFMSNTALISWAKVCRITRQASLREMELRLAKGKDQLFNVCLTQAFFVVCCNFGVAVMQRHLVYSPARLEGLLKISAGRFDIELSKKYREEVQRLDCSGRVRVIRIWVTKTGLECTWELKTEKWTTFDPLFEDQSDSLPTLCMSSDVQADSLRSLRLLARIMFSL